MAVTVRVIPFYAICIASAMLLALLTLPLQAAQLHAVPAPVAVLKLEGAVSPVLAAYVSHGIARAAHEHAQLIILTVDTPGGLDTSMREIIKSILASGVPIASFVSPGGARAASAGTFILYASHIAAMAPGTNLGAATPIALGGGQQAVDDPARHKAINDAAAYIRSLARLRNRNADWGELAVREAASLSAEEAQKRKVIDLVATDLPDLMRQLHVANAPLLHYPPDWRVQLLAVVTDPGIAVLLIMIGVVGLFIEFTHTGLVVPGVLGGICLLLGLFALQMLPVNFAGLALLGLGIAFMLAEAFLPSYGALGLGGIVAFVLGAIVLMDTDLPGYGIPLTVIVTAAILSALLIATLGGLALRSWRRTSVIGDSELLGVVAEVVDVTPEQIWIHLHGERWQAQCRTPLKRGQRVRVVARHGLQLEVELSDIQSNRENDDGT